MALFTLGIGAASARAEASRIIVDTLTNSAPDALPFTTTYVDPYGGNVGVGLWFVPDVDCQVIAIETAFRLDAGGPSGVDGVFSLIDNDTNTPIEMYTVPWNANDGVVGAPFHAILRKDHGYTVAYVPQPVPGQAVSGSWRSVQTAPSTTLAHDLAETGVAYEQYLAGVTYYGSYDGPQPGPLPAFRITALVDDQAGDTDGDGVDDATDNCIEVANADQADRDRDGVGDACDTCPDLYNPAQQSCASTNGNGSAGGGAATVDGGGCSAGGGASSLLVAVLLLAGTRLASRSRGRTT